MVVLSVTNCPPKMRGDLTKWMTEIDVGVYVGQLSSRVREKLWERVLEYIGSGKAILVYNTNNEQGFEIITHNTEWKPVDYEGLILMHRPQKELDNAEKHNSTKMISNARKYQMSRQVSKKDHDGRGEFIIIDIETTGLNYESDKIIEIGLLKIVDNKVVGEYQSFVNFGGTIPENITKLTGITQKMIEDEGKDEITVIEDIKTFIGSNQVYGYNVQFDLKFLKKLCDDNEVDFFITKSKDVKKTIKQKIVLQNYKMETVANYYDIDVSSIHRALEDCKILYGIVKQLNKK